MRNLCNVKPLAKDYSGKQVPADASSTDLSSYMILSRLPNNRQKVVCPRRNRTVKSAIWKQKTSCSFIMATYHFTSSFIHHKSKGKLVTLVGSFFKYLYNAYIDLYKTLSVFITR